MKTNPIFLILLYSILLFPFSDCRTAVSSSLDSSYYIQLDNQSLKLQSGNALQVQPAKVGLLKRLKVFFKHQMPQEEGLPRGWAVAFGILFIILGIGNMLGGIFLAFLGLIGFNGIPIVVGVLLGLLGSIGGIALGALGLKLLFPKMRKKKRWLLSLVVNVVVALGVYSLAWANGSF
jgi:hypothetical protein